MSTRNDVGVLYLIESIHGFRAGFHSLSRSVRVLRQTLLKDLNLLGCDSLNVRLCFCYLLDLIGVMPGRLYARYLRHVW
jgi:hypothetical protein